MKREWKKLQLEVLDVGNTMLDPNNGDKLDKAYPAGTRRHELTWS